SQLTIAVQSGEVRRLEHNRLPPSEVHGRNDEPCFRLTEQLASENLGQCGPDGVGRVLRLKQVVVIDPKLLPVAVDETRFDSFQRATQLCRRAPCENGTPAFAVEAFDFGCWFMQGNSRRDDRACGRACDEIKIVSKPTTQFLL